MRTSYDLNINLLCIWRRDLFASIYIALNGVISAAVRFLNKREVFDSEDNSLRGIEQNLL